MRILNVDLAPRLPYVRPSENTRSVNHWGQRKLLLSEIEFLTLFTGRRAKTTIATTAISGTTAMMPIDTAAGATADMRDLPSPSGSKDDNDDNNGRPLVVYAGAAPGTHINYLANLFPHVDFLLVDPSDFCARPVEEDEETTNLADRTPFLSSPPQVSFRPTAATTTTTIATATATVATTATTATAATKASLTRRRLRIRIRQEFFTDDVCRQVLAENRDILFISDIRTADPKVLSVTQVEEAISHDMQLQMGWHRLLNARASMLKFRLPWDGGKTTYLDGDIYLPVWGRETTTECRLVVRRGADTKIYDNRRYEEQMFYFNRVTRVEYYDHTYAPSGLRFDSNAVAMMSVIDTQNSATTREKKTEKREEDGEGKCEKPKTDASVAIVPFGCDGVTRDVIRDVAHDIIPDHNVIASPDMTKTSIPMVPGLDHCYDCAAEMHILGEYVCRVALAYNTLSNNTTERYASSDARAAAAAAAATSTHGDIAKVNPTVAKLVAQMSLDMNSHCSRDERKCRSLVYHETSHQRRMWFAPKSFDYDNKIVTLLNSGSQQAIIGVHQHAHEEEKPVIVTRHTSGECGSNDSRKRRYADRDTSEYASVLNDEKPDQAYAARYSSVATRNNHKRRFTSRACYSRSPSRDSSPYRSRGRRSNHHHHSPRHVRSGHSRSLSYHHRRGRTRRRSCSPRCSDDQRRYRSRSSHNRYH